MKTRLINFLIVVLTTFVSGHLFSQAPTRAQLQPVNARYQWESGGFKNVMYLPLDTPANAEVGALAYKSGKPYVKDTLRWNLLTAGGSVVADNMANHDLSLSGDRTHNGMNHYFILDTLAYLQYMVYRDDPFLGNKYYSKFYLDSTINGFPFRFISALRNASNTGDSIHTQIGTNQNGAFIYNYGDNGNRLGNFQFLGNDDSARFDIYLSSNLKSSHLSFGRTAYWLPADSSRWQIMGASSAPKMIGLRAQAGDVYTPVAIDMGNFITKLHGSVIAEGPGDAAATLNATGVVPGPYTNPSVTINSEGRVTSAVNGTPTVNVKDIDVFLIAGQSNAVGQGDSLLSPRAISGKVLQINKGVITDANDPIGVTIGTSATRAHYGSAWPAFGNTYYNRTSRLICMVPSSVNGTSQTVAGDVGNGNWDTTGVLFDSSVARVNSSIAALIAKGYNPIFKGVMWLQGESDAIALEAATITQADYIAAFRKMIKKYRNIYGVSMPFNVIRIGTSSTHPDSFWKTIRDAQQTVANTDSATQIVYFNANNFITRSLMIDNIHFNQVGLNEVGRLSALAVTSHIKNIWQAQDANMYYTTGNVGIGGNNTSGYGLDIISRDPTGNDGIRISNRNTGANATAAIRFDTDAGQGALFFLTSTAGGTNIGGSKAFTVASLQTGGLRLVSNIGGDIVFSKSTNAAVTSWARIVAPTGDFLYNTDVDNAALGKFQVHGTSVFDSLMRLQNVSTPPSAYNVLVHSTDDSGVYQVPLSLIGGQNFANADLNFTGDRTHNGKSHAFGIDSLSSYYWLSRSTSGGVKTRGLLSFDPSGNSFLISNTVRKADNTGDSLNVNINTFSSGEFLSLNAANSAGRSSGIALYSSPTKSYTQFISDSINMQSPIRVTDTVFMAGGFDISNNTRSLTVAPVSALTSAIIHNWAQTADATVANTTTETTLLGAGSGSLTILPKEWAVGKTFTVTLYGTLGVDVGNPGTTTFRTKLGSVNLCATSGIFQGSVVSDRHFELTVSFTCRSTGATGTVFAQGQYRDANSSINVFNNSNATATIDMTTNQTFDLTLQWSQAAANNTATSFVTLFKSEN